MGISDWIRVGVAGCLGLFLAGCGDEHFISKDKLEIVVTTPDGDVTGSTVYEAHSFVGRGLLVSGGVYRTASFHGEAIALKLPDGRYLFVPFVENQYALADKLFSADVEKNRHEPGNLWEYERVLASMRGRRRVSLDLYPPMLTFRNLNDPHSAMLVTRENFAGIFGPGMQIKAMYLTQLDPDVPVSKTGVRTLLPWLKSFGDSPDEYFSFKKQPWNPTDLIQIAPNEFVTNRIDISSSNFVTDLYK